MKHIKALSWRLLAIGLMTLPSGASAAAWTMASGHGQAIMTLMGSRASKAFDDSRSLVSTPRYSKLDLQALLEYGATNRLTLILSPGLQRVEIGTGASSVSGTPEYIEFGARYRIWSARNWVFSAQTTMRRIGSANTSNASPVDVTGTEVDVRGLAGHSFTLWRKPAFLDVQVAHRFRSGGSPNEVHADVTVGIRPSAKWLLLGQSFNVVSEGAGDPGFPHYDYFKFQPSAIYQLTKHWAVQAGAFSTYKGRNALQENGLVLGAWVTF